MSPGLPSISGRDAVRALERLGYVVVRQHGSHIRLRHPKDPARQPLTIHDHKNLKPGLLRGLIRDAQIGVDDFLKLLRCALPESVCFFREYRALPFPTSMPPIVIHSGVIGSRSPSP